MYIYIHKYTFKYNVCIEKKEGYILTAGEEFI